MILSSVLVSSGAAFGVALLAESNAPIYAGVATGMIALVLAPIVNGRMVERKLRVEARLRRDEARADADMAREERAKDREELRKAAKEASDEAREQAENARKDANANIAALAAAQAEQQAALLESNNRIADASVHNTAEIAAIKATGDVIKINTITAVHLADGALTAALEAQLWALKGKKAAHEMLIAYKSSAHQPTTAEEAAVLIEDEKRVAMLEAQIEARHEAMAVAMAGGQPPPQPIVVDTASITVVEAKPLEVKNVAEPDQIKEK